MTKNPRKALSAIFGDFLWSLLDYANILRWELGSTSGCLWVQSIGGDYHKTPERWNADGICKKQNRVNGKNSHKRITCNISTCLTDHLIDNLAQMTSKYSRDDQNQLVLSKKTRMALQAIEKKNVQMVEDENKKFLKMGNCDQAWKRWKLCN